MTLLSRDLSAVVVKCDAEYQTMGPVLGSSFSEVCTELPQQWMSKGFKMHWTKVNLVQSMPHETAPLVGI